MPPPPPLALITLANPALLWGMAACAGPVVIHLLLRSRPRPQPFPAMQFLLASQTASIREHRLKHLLLLLLRMAAIALIALALARPVSRGSWLSARTRDRTAAALVIDDSASMNARFEGRTRLDRAKAWAGDLIRDQSRFPDGSTFVILSAGGGPTAPRPVTNPTDAARAIEAVGPGDHDFPLGPSVDRALAAAAASSLPIREVYVFTDNTSAAWSDAQAGRWAGQDQIAAFVVDVAEDARSNARLAPAQPLGPTAPPRTPLRATARVLAGDRSLETYVDAFVDGAVAARSEPFSVPADGRRDISVVLPPLSPGVHGVELRLAASDLLDIDDSLFFAVDVREPPRVLIVHTTANAADDDEARRIEALLCPPTLPTDRRPILVTRADVDARGPTSSTGPSPGASGLGQYRLIVWIGLPTLGDEAAQAYDGYLRGGGRVLIVPSAAPSTANPAPPWLPGRMGRTIDLAEPRHLQWVRASVQTSPADATPGTGLPTSAPAAEPGTVSEIDVSRWTRDDVDPLSARIVTRFVELTPARDAQLVARLESGAPAILARRAGRGLAVQWATRLDGDWSDLGVRAATAMVLLHGLVADGGEPSRRVAQLRCGRTIGLQIDPGAISEDWSIDRVLGKRGGAAEASRGATPAGEFTAGARSAGLFLARSSAGGARPLAAWSVNLAEGETRDDRVAPEAVRALFAQASTLVLRDPTVLAARTLSVAGDRELDGYLLFAVLALLAIEALVANRFYRAAA